MEDTPLTTRPKPGLFANDQVRFAVLLTVVATALIVALLMTRARGHELRRPVENIALRVDDRHRTRQARALRAACRRADCSCVETAARAGLDVDAGRAVLDLLDAARTCTFPALAGIRAQALVRAQAPEGERIAHEVLDRNSRDVHAVVAMALAAYRAGAVEVTAAMLESAVADGAGDGARALLGVALYQKGDLARARTAFETMLSTEPDDLDALYNLALVAQKQDRYGEARKLYLKVLRSNPKHLQARYNLAILAHSIGADSEAQHHLELFAKAAPNDPRVGTLRQALAEPTKRPGQVLTLGARPAGSAR